MAIVVRFKVCVFGCCKTSYFMVKSSYTDSYVVRR